MEGIYTGLIVIAVLWFLGRRKKFDNENRNKKN